MEPENPISGIVEKIAKECEQAGASTWTITRIIKELSEQETGDPEKLRRQALDILKKTEPQTANVFASFQKMDVRTSKLKIERFDRGNIIKSLIKETNINRGIAETIGKEVENKIKDLNIHYLNTALIREMVNAKLLEYGHEGIRRQYARLGIPVHDAEKKMEKNALHSKEISIEYSLLKVIPKELSDFHLKSDIFIAALEDFSTKPLSCSIKIEQKETPEQTALEAIKQAAVFSKIFSYTPNINGLNISLAKKMKKNRVKENAGFAIQALNCTQTGNKKTGSIMLHTFMPEEFGEMKAEKETSEKLAGALLENRKQLNTKFEFAVSVDSKYKLKLFERSQLDGLKILNCNKEQNMLLNGIPARKELQSLFGVNLEKIAFEAAESERRFFEKLDSVIEATAKLREIKTTELSKRAYLKNHGIRHEELDSAIALFGLYTASGTIAGETKKDIIDFCEKTLKRISGQLEKEWIITELSDRNGINRFRNANRHHYDGREEKTTEQETGFMQFKLQQKNFYWKATAQNEKQLQELIEKNVPVVEARFGGMPI